MQQILKIPNNIKKFLQDSLESLMQPTDAGKINSEFVQLENENQEPGAPQKIKSPPVSFDHILTEHIQFGKYQYMASLIICNGGFFLGFYWFCSF